MKKASSKEGTPMSIKTLLAAFLLSFALSVTAADVQLNPDHPQEYTVVKGALGHRQPLPEGSLALAGCLAGQPSD